VRCQVLNWRWEQQRGRGGGEGAAAGWGMKGHRRDCWQGEGARAVEEV